MSKKQSVICILIVKLSGKVEPQSEATFIKITHHMEWVWGAPCKYESKGSGR